MKKLLPLIFLSVFSTSFLKAQEDTTNSTQQFEVKRLKFSDVKKHSPEPGTTLPSQNNLSTNSSSSQAELSETAGALSVSLTGGATYTIPIKVPGGIDGVEPEIAITYNSQGGNGMAGFGWNLSGISVISRTSATKYHDSEIQPIDLSESDRFILDGQRLILKSGTYGEDGAEYQTEKYSSLKIESFGSSYDGPQYFKVSYPDGSVAMYGQTFGSRSRMDYAITYWENPQGIQISYEYMKSFNSLSISKIKYGAKGTATPPNEIQFSYKNRKRPEQSYSGGVRFVRKTILDEINVISNGNGYRNYEISHEDNSLGYEVISSIQEKSGDNSQSFAPIVFQYTETSNAIQAADATAQISLSNVEQRNAIATSLDADGNGKMDFTIHSKTSAHDDKFWLFKNIQDLGSGVPNFHYEINVGKFESLFPVNWLTATNKKLAGQGMVVVQNSGTTDVDFRVLGEHYYYGLSPQYTKTWEAPTYSVGYSCDAPPGSTRRVPQDYISGDFNGDGLTDVIAISKPYSEIQCFPILTPPGEPCGFDPYLALKNSVESNSINIEEPTYGPTQDEKTETQNINECCRCETRTRNTPRLHFINLKRDITSNFAKSIGYLGIATSSKRILTGDINGDGKTNIIVIHSGIVNVYNLDENENINLLFTYNDSELSTTRLPMLGDYNGDGKTDMLLPTADNSSSFRMLLSTGDGFSGSTTTYPFTYKETNYNGSGTLYGYNLVPTDINGDGRTDIIDYRTTTYNNSSSGSQTVRVYNNTFSSNYYATPQFSFSNSKSQAGDLKHFPIPIFLTSEENNNNLDFAAISDNQVTSFGFSKDNREDMLLRGVTNNGVTQEIDYRDLQSGSEGNSQVVYYPTLEETYPYVDIEQARGFKVVSSLERSGGDIEIATKDFSYYGGVSNYEGLGFSGFKGMATSNWYTSLNNKINNISMFDPHLRGAPIMEYSTTSYVNFTSNPSDYISKTEHEYDFNEFSNKVYELNKSYSSSINELEGTTTTKNYYYDNFNNPEKIVTHYSDGSEKRVEIGVEDSPSGSSYYIGRLTSQNTTTLIDGNSYNSVEEYDYTSGGLIAEKRTKGDGTSFITQEYTYDTFGNLTSKKTTPPGEAAREVLYDYDTSGRFLTKKTDVEGLETEYEYHSTSGRLVKETDDFGFETSYEYDAWFRPVKITDYLGNEATTTYQKSNNRYTVTATSDDGSSKVSVYDQLNRPIEERQKDVLGQWVKKRIEYDHNGQVTRESEPFTGNSPSQWNETEYDIYGRVTKKIAYTGKTVNISYEGLESTIDDGTKTETIIKDVLGNIKEKTDPGGTITYTYFGNGKLKKAVYENTSLEIEQDGWGRKTKLIDPSAGTYTYEYNGFGETTKEITPKGETEYEYSNVGRLESKTITGDDTGITLDYSYNGQTKLLTGITMANSDGSNIEYTYTYDSYHRKLSEKEEILDHAEFTTTYTYNSLGQIITEDNEAVDLTSGETFSIKTKNIYQNGGVLEIRDFSSNDLLWEIEGLNARGQIESLALGDKLKEETQYDNLGFVEEINTIKEETSGDTNLISLGFDFDTQRGNLEERSNSLFNWNEDFSYDNLDRLTAFNDNDGNNNQNYDPRGRITGHSQIGSFGYTGTSYQQTSLNLNASGEDHYDDLDTQHISYNAFKQPVEIEETGKDKVSFEYNAFEERASMFYGGTENDKTQRRYRKHFAASGKMELKYDDDTGKTTFINYIDGDAYNASVIYHSEKGSSTNANYFFLHRDYLGSILAITDVNGNFKEKRHFDAWGNIVKLEDGNGNSLSSFKILDRGYTGHEHLLGVGIVHMNGRLYDPVLHRFLSPDDHVQDPFNSQNFNRYTYVLNNPLKYSDPSGEFFEPISLIIGSVLSVGILIANAIWGDHEPQNVNFSNNNQPSSPSTPSNNSQENNSAAHTNGGSMENTDLEIPSGVQTPYWLSSMQKTRIAHTFSPNDWIKDRYGAYLWDDSAIDQASTRSGWKYVGKELPNGVHRLDILTEIDGRLYHKNTNDVFASLFNYLGADFVEHKPYEPVTARALNEGIATGAGYAAGGLALRGVSGIAGRTGIKAIQAGNYTFTKTSAKHLATRPYMNSPSTITNIMKSSKGVPDQFFKGGMNYKVPGTFNGSKGVYELGINPQTNTIYHFLFKTTK